MKINRGKQFEERFRKDWERTFPKSFILRLKDNTSQYKNESQNPCDFICFKSPKLHLIECKAHYGTTVNFKSDIRQLDLLSLIFY